MPHPVPPHDPADTLAPSVWHRRQWLQATGAAGLVLCAPAVWAQPASAAAEEVKAGPMPALGTPLRVPRIALFDGSVFEPAQHSGKPLLVYWWSSTCPFCALQSPSMEAFWRAHRGQGLQMLALSIDRQPEAAVAYLKNKGYTFPAAWASAQWRAGFSKPKGLPITLMVDRKGLVVAAEKGQMFPEDVQALSEYLI